MFRDKLIFGALAGVAADLVMGVPELILWKQKVLSHPLFHYAGSLFLPLDVLHGNYLAQLMGFLASKVYGAFLGVIFIYLLVHTGYRYPRAKGLLYGSFLWLASYCGLATLPIVKLSVHPPTPLETLLFFFLHLLYGFVLGMLAHAYASHRETLA